MKATPLSAHNTSQTPVLQSASYGKYLGTGCACCEVSVHDEDGVLPAQGNFCSGARRRHHGPHWQVDDGVLPAILPALCRRLIAEGPAHLLSTGSAIWAL